MESRNVLKLGEFFSVCSQMVHQSGKIIQGVFDPKGTVFQTKNGDEPFTEADVQVQTLITKGLRLIWPDIKIIGEEEEESQTLQFDFNTLRTDLIPKDFDPELVSTEIDLSKAIVWIDPLDGTQDFVKGSLDSVTTLIGIAVENKAKVGVVGKYFIQNEPGKYDWQPRCYFAHADIQRLHYFDYLNDSKIVPIKPVIATPESDEIVLCTTMNHFNDALKEKIEKVNPSKVLQIGGAGNKVLSLVIGTADCYFYPQPGMKNWDICAPEAILRSAGGVVTDQFNVPLHLGEEKSTWLCAKGVVASITQEKHNKLMGNYLKN